MATPQVLNNIFTVPTEGNPEVALFISEERATEVLDARADAVTAELQRQLDDDDSLGVQGIAMTLTRPLVCRRPFTAIFNSYFVCDRLDLKWAWPIYLLDEVSDIIIYGCYFAARDATPLRPLMTSPEEVNRFLIRVKAYDEKL